MPYIPQHVRAKNCAVIQCSQCVKGVSEAQGYFQCDKCLKCFHAKCKNILGQNITRLAQCATWLCSDACSQQPLADDVTVSVDHLTPGRNAGAGFGFDNDDASDKVGFPEIMRQLKQMEKKLITLEELYGVVFDLKTENDLLKERMRSLELKLESNNDKLHLFEAEIDKPYQALNASNITISGLPIKHDNIHGLVLNTLSKIVGSIQVDDILSITPISRSNKSTTIKKTNHSILSNDFFIVKLKSIALQNSLLAQMRVKKTLYTTELDIPLPPNHPKQQIYIMHQFTRFQSQLYKEAKNIKVKLNYKYLWCKSGQIYLRKSDGSDVYRINSLNDIFRIKIPAHPDKENDEI